MNDVMFTVLINMMNCMSDFVNDTFYNSFTFCYGLLNDCLSLCWIFLSDLLSFNFGNLDNLFGLSSSSFNLLFVSLDDLLNWFLVGLLHNLFTLLNSNLNSLFGQTFSLLDNGLCLLWMSSLDLFGVCFGFLD